MGGLPCAPGSYLGAVEVEEVGRITGLCPGGAGCTRGAPGDDSPCPVNC
jgi:hypothetical protein